jgi:beta-mannosidase
MKTFFLHDNWVMKRIGGGTIASANMRETVADCIPAKVPGSVYNDLLTHKKMADPFWRDNEDASFALMENDFEYNGVFIPPDALFQCDKVVLHFDGLDTLADIYLNGIFIGNAYNQHRIWEYDVSSVLKKGAKNELRVVFYSPNKFVRDAYKKVKTDGSYHCYDGFPQLRKAHCSFGWDWGPRLPDAGIWRPVKLAGIEGARVKSVYITQKHDKDTVTLRFNPVIETVRDVKTAYEVIVTAPDGTRQVYGNSPGSVVIHQPELWWCNGFGKQPLYTAQVNLIDTESGKTLDCWERRIGLRTITVSREKDTWGESFAFELNGTRIFSMGADYIPEDSLFSRMSPQRTRQLLEYCVQSHFNTIRVWGGGFYPDDYFFDICDELGILVWQDFMFACAVYELTGDFEENIRAEIIDNVTRLRHHACLALWCGNNEMEDFVDQWMWVSTHKQKADYIKMYEYIFPKLAREYDPDRFYWPSSPSSGGSFDKPNDPDRGDVHYWEVWHGNKPFSEYRKYFYRYLSEFGFQSFPSVKTIETFTEPEDRNIFSYIMEKHQRNDAANGKIMNYLSQYFLYPARFDTLVYASQLLQAEAIKYGVEHFRRNRGRCMGAVYWQLNDIWPVASWSSIDYFHRWKALQYYAKRFFAPLMISCHEEGLLTQDLNVNAQNKQYEKSFHLCVANETREERKTEVRWEIRDNTARVLESGRETVTVKPLSSAWLSKMERPELDPFTQYLSYALYENDRLVEESTVIFSVPKFFHYKDPKLSYTAHDDTITVKAETYAKCVEIRNSAENIVLSDNYFDMNAGEKTVRILSGKPTGIKLRSVYDIR